MWVVGEVTEKQQRAEQAALFPLGPLPSQRSHMGYPTLVNTSAPYYVTGAPRQKNMAQMKEQIKAPEKIQLSSEEIANISDAEFKTLLIRMLTEMVENGLKIEEEVKAMKNEIKENVQGTDSHRKETRTQINDLE